MKSPTINSETIGQVHIAESIQINENNTNMAGQGDQYSAQILEIQELVQQLKTHFEQSDLDIKMTLDDLTAQLAALDAVATQEDSVNKINKIISGFDNAAGGIVSLIEKLLKLKLLIP